MCSYVTGALPKWERASWNTSLWTTDLGPSCHRLCQGEMFLNSHTLVIHPAESLHWTVSWLSQVPMPCYLAKSTDILVTLCWNVVSQHKLVTLFNLKTHHEDVCGRERSVPHWAAESEFWTRWNFFAPLPHRARADRQRDYQLQSDLGLE